MARRAISLPFSGRVGRSSLLALAFAVGGPEPRLLDWQAKVHRSCGRRPQMADQDLLVVLEEQADSERGSRHSRRRRRRASYVYEQLKAAAERTQGPLLQGARSAGAVVSELLGDQHGGGARRAGSRRGAGAEGGGASDRAEPADRGASASAEGKRTRDGDGDGLGEALTPRVRSGI